LQNKYSSSGAANYANSNDRMAFSQKQSPSGPRSGPNGANPMLNVSVNGEKGKMFAPYAMSGPSPNVTNRALSLSTNLGKAGGGSGTNKSKQQSILSIYSEKN
jgi:hypothetical protein